jgi:hypothetical protein
MTLIERDLEKWSDLKMTERNFKWNKKKAIFHDNMVYPLDISTKKVPIIHG